MFGCLRRLGCLVVLVVVAVMLYLNRDALPSQLVDLIPRVGGTAERTAEPTAVADGSWQPLTPEGAARARTSVQSLSKPRGPVYTNVAGADLASFVADELRRQRPPSAEDVEAAIFGDQLHVRTVIRLSDLGGSRVLGPLSQFLSERDTVQFGGTFDVVRPGLAEFRVRQIKLRQLSIPSRLVPQILGQLNRGERPEGVAEDGLPLEIPPYVGDVRIARGRVTLYKTTQ
jgi:hypothetical protein